MHSITSASRNRASHVFHSTISTSFPSNKSASLKFQQSKTTTTRKYKHRGERFGCCNDASDSGMILAITSASHYPSFRPGNPADPVPPAVGSARPSRSDGADWEIVFHGTPKCFFEPTVGLRLSLGNLQQGSH